MERDPSSWDARLYGQTARYMSALGEPLVDVLAAQPGERVLDLGCGDGALTEKIAACGADVVGVDSSEAMVIDARLRGLDAGVADAYQLPFESEFDAVFSNSALHWMKRPDDAIRQVRRSLRVGGRFVGELGAAGNVGTVLTALRKVLSTRGVDFDEVNPFYFPTGYDYERRLVAEGFSVESIEVLDHRTPIPGDVGGWLQNFWNSFFQSLSKAERAEAVAEVVEAVRPALCDADGHWAVDHVRLRFVARQPG